MSESAIGWFLLALFTFAGVGLLFARVDDREVQRFEALNRVLFGVRPYKYPWFRFAMAAACLLMAAVVYFSFLSEHPQ